MGDKEKEEGAPFTFIRGIGWSQSTPVQVHYLVDLVDFAYGLPQALGYAYSH